MLLVTVHRRATLSARRSMRYCDVIYDVIVESVRVSGAHDPDV